MRRIIPFTILLMTLAACAALNGQTPEPVATVTHLANVPNPASVYCEKTGNELEIQTAPDGSQAGVCVFPDGSTCDEWAYFRGECGPTAQEDTAPSATVETTPNASGGGPGGGSSAQEDGSGGYIAPGSTEEFSDWWGVVRSTPDGADCDDYFERQDLGQVIFFGIDSLDPTVESQIEALRDSGKIVHLFGTLFSNVPDYNGSQVQVDRIEVEE